ncbi:class I adenylate-forming enzyme family protein [Phenylobacterium sp.]|uniref:class I adenylate-forming enzyme family protein n=1 Tax=Phenylobacterium sp. TaxID=1871053 RepID=UPI002FC96058
MPGPTKTSAQWITAHSTRSANMIAFRDDSVSITYLDLHAQVQALAAGFRGLGVGKGDVVAAQLPNGLEFILCYLATSRLGAVLQPIHMPYRAAEIEPLLRHGQAKAIVCLSQAKDYSPAELALSLQESLPHLEVVIAVGDGAPQRAIPFERLRRGSATSPEVDVTPEDDFVLLYTSGTTASPKGIRVGYSRFLANAEACASELGLKSASVLLSAAPFSHLYGLLTVNLTIVTGASSVGLATFTPEALAAALDAHRPTAVFVAPAHIASCLSLGLLTPERLASLEFVMISGSTCPPELASDLQALMPNGKVCQLWGMSELQVGAFTRPTDPVAVRLASVGRASPGTELRVTEDGALAPAGVEGELQVRGISVFESYLDNPAASAEAFTPDGWFKTGDLAKLSVEGDVRLTGRLKDLINRGGVKFNPTDVEAVIDRHPSVAVSAIVPMPDPVLGERACCFVVLTPGGSVHLEDLQAWLATHQVAKNRWPERLDIIAEMPMTPTRKIKKAELARLVVQLK